MDVFITKCNTVMKIFSINDEDRTSYGLFTMRVSHRPRLYWAADPDCIGRQTQTVLGGILFH